MQRARRPHCPPLARLTASHALRVAGVLALVLSTPAWALYKVVGPDGKVTYTDRAPTDQPSQTLKTNGAATDTSSLPFVLREVVGKYPVTLYTASGCAPCDQGRTALKSRGIPFTEKTVQSTEDVAALQRTEGTQQVPVLRVGQQQVRGYSEREWGAYLDAAGYPKQSILPRGYAWGSATPLVQLADTAPAAKKTPGTATSTPAPRQQVISPAPDNGSGSPSSPSGIRF
jgi:glutaredoxin